MTEATTGFEPVIRVLQTHALPLGYVALCHALFARSDIIAIELFSVNINLPLLCKPLNAEKAFLLV